MTPDPFRYLRDRQSAMIAQIDRGSVAPPDATARIVGQVFDNGALPTTTGKYFAVHPVTVGGTESEGSPVTFDVDSSTVLYFLVIGPKVPVVGDYLIGHAIGGRWVARRGKLHTSNIFQANCQPCGAAGIPPVLNLTIANYPGFTDCGFFAGSTACGSPTTYAYPVTDTLTYTTPIPDWAPNSTDGGGHSYTGVWTGSNTYLITDPSSFVTYTARAVLFCGGSVFGYELLFQDVTATGHNTIRTACVVTFGGGGGPNRVSFSCPPSLFFMQNQLGFFSSPPPNGHHAGGCIVTIAQP